MINFKHDFKLSDSIKKQKNLDASMIWAVNRSEYFFICGLNVVSSESKTIFSTRSIFRFAMIDFTSFEKMKSYVKNLKVQFESLISKQLYRDVIRLFYQYKHLNSINFTNLSSINFIIYKMKLIFEIKFHSVEQRR